LPLTDVMPPGHHAVVMAGVEPGASVAVVGDRAVGLCAVLAARRAGAARIFALGRHADRGAVAARFGATDVLPADDPATVELIREATGGGVPAGAECVGNQSALDLALRVVRPGSRIGSVGVPSGVEQENLGRMFRHNVTLSAGVAPVRRYLDGLVADVLAGELAPSPVLTADITLPEIADGYRAMDRPRRSRRPYARDRKGSVTAFGSAATSLQPRIEGCEPCCASP